MEEGGTQEVSVPPPKTALKKTVFKKHIKKLLRNVFKNSKGR